MAGALKFSAARETPDVAALNAPLFAGLMERMKDDTRRVVLDLGPARPETVAMFDGCRCRLEVVDLAEDLAALRAADGPEQVDAVLRTLLPPPRAETIDVVLCWDLLNYLERPALTALMNAVRGRLGPGSLVHAFIVYSAPQMSARPARIVPGEDRRLRFFPQAAAEIKAPRYTPDDLARCMPGFTVERAMLLKNGMQEFLFRH